MHGDGIVRAGDIRPSLLAEMQKAIEAGVKIGRSEVNYAIATFCTFMEECRVKGSEAKPPRYLSDYEVERLATAAVNELLQDRQYKTLDESSRRESVVTTGAMVWLLAAGRL